MSEFRGKGQETRKEEADPTKTYGYSSGYDQSQPGHLCESLGLHLSRLIEPLYPLKSKVRRVLHLLLPKQASNWVRAVL